MFKIENLHAGVEGREILKGVNLEINAGEVHAIMGPNGSGKSTLLHVMAGLEKPDTGTVILNDTNMWMLNESGRAKLRREKMAVVFQQYNLINSLTIGQNISFLPKLAGRHDSSFIRKTVDALGLSNILSKYPEQTSGGQQQRTALARALVSKPSVIFADEPTGNLDEDNTQRVIEVLTKFTNNMSTSLIVATHSELLASKMNSVTVLEGGTLKLVKT